VLAADDDQPELTSRDPESALRLLRLIGGDVEQRAGQQHHVVHEQVGQHLEILAAPLTEVRQLRHIVGQLFGR